MTDLVIDFDKQLERQALYSILKDLKGEQVIKIKKRVKGRTIPQNKYYWGVVLEYIQQTTGDSKDYLHEVYKGRHIPNVKFIDEFELSTADMTTEEMNNYIECVRMDAKLTLGIAIPDPDGVIL